MDQTTCCRAEASSCSIPNSAEQRVRTRGSVRFYRIDFADPAKPGHCERNQILAKALTKGKLTPFSQGETGGLMIRILLPLAIIAAIFFGPMFSETTTGSSTGTSETVRSGAYFISETIECIRKLQIPIGEECASGAKLNGSTMVGEVISGATILALGAAIIGIFGLLPFVGRLTSIVTILAGVGALVAMGYFAVAMMGGDDGLAGVQWGVYLTSGLGLLTLISGLSGTRGN